MKKRLKILITSDLYTVRTNGVVTSITNLADELRRKGHDVRILTLSDCAESFIEGHVYYMGSFSMEQVYPGVRGSLSRKNRIIAELIQWNPDIIHSQCEFFSFRFAKVISRHCGAPIVHTYHTLYEDYIGYARVPSAVGKRLVKHFSRQRLKAAQSVIAPSQKTFSILKGYGVNQEMHVIPSGISIETQCEAYPLEKKAALRRKLGLTDDAFVLLSLGRLGKEKNIDELLICMSWVVEDHPKTMLLIVGDGPEKTELEGWVSHLKLEQHVVFTGAVPPEMVHTYYQIADVFVSASTSETQGLVYIEAAANGLPLICRKDPCLQGILEEGKNGFSYETIEEFETAYAQCAGNEVFRNSASTVSRQSAMHYSKQQFANRVEDVYFSLLSDQCKHIPPQEKAI